MKTEPKEDKGKMLWNAGKGFSGSKKEKSSENAAPSYVVTPSGFKPETF
ncbi:MAG: hypothetical protein ABIP35_16940 [Ginsengibacter sp.]